MQQFAQGCTFMICKYDWANRPELFYERNTSAFASSWFTAQAQAAAVARVPCTSSCAWKLPEPLSGR